jgi:formylglycine-generating enzyme required for sulfatase activity
VFGKVSWPPPRRARSEFDAARCNTKEGGLDTTTPVGQYSPHGDSPYGVADMAGNVWEWCADWFQAYEGNRFPDDAYGERPRVVRGGSWFFFVRFARCACRPYASPSYFFATFGVRVVVSARSLPQF